MHQKIRIARRAVVVVDPGAYQHSALQKEPITVLDHGKPVTQAFKGDAHQDDSEARSSLRAMLSSRSLTDFARLTGTLAI